jgi:hypothetical protein
MVETSTATRDPDDRPGTRRSSLNDERKATMMANLLVVLYGEQRAHPGREHRQPQTLSSEQI